MKIFVLAMMVVTCAVAQDIPEEWLTTYEQSGYVATGRYDECIRFCEKLDSVSDDIEFLGNRVTGGHRGHIIPFLGVNLDQKELPLIFIVAGIHSGEIDGKDAGLMLLRDYFVLGKHKGLFDKVRMIYCPIFNVDGHERVSAYNRINQVGPEEQGFRTTAQNLNLNRDWLKADAPEMRSMVHMIDETNPDFLVDLHVTNGADYQYVITYGLGIDENEQPSIQHYSRDIFLPEIISNMKNRGYDFVPYVELKGRTDIFSGWKREVWPPRYSTGYGALIGRPFMLIETHSLKDYKTRVTSMYEYLIALIETITKQSKDLKEAVRLADLAEMGLAGKTIPLDFELSPDSTMLPFKGVEFHKEYSEISGDSVIRWGKTPKDYQVSFFDRNVATKSVTVPYAYIIPKPWVEKLSPIFMAHNIPHYYTNKDTTLEVDTYLLENVKFDTIPFEGRWRVNFTTKPIRKTVQYLKGSWVITTVIRNAPIAIHLLEPDAPDSFLKWGFLNQIFEQKEGFDDYVMEPIAEKMLQENPELAKEFQEKLAGDSKFANDPKARLQFFYERSPWWDDRKNVSPFGKIDLATFVNWRFLSLESGIHVRW